MCSYSECWWCRHGSLLDLEQEITKASKKAILIVMADLNTKIGNMVRDEQLRKLIGKYGPGKWKESGERLLQFALDCNLCITNTMFQHQHCRLSTWTSPNGQHKNPIDSIMSGRWESFRESDHKLLKLKFRIKLQSNKRPVLQQKRVLNNFQSFRKAVICRIEGGEVPGPA